MIFRYPKCWELDRLNDTDGIARKFNGLARADFAALAGFKVAVDGDQFLCHHLFAFTTRHDEVGGFEQLAQLDVFTRDWKFHNKF